MAGRGQLIVGTADGSVYTIDRDCNLSQFVAHGNTLTHMHLNRQSNYLFTIGVRCVTYLIRISSVCSVFKVLPMLVLVV